MPGAMTLRFGQTHTVAPTTTTRAYIVPGFAGPVYVNTSFTTAHQYVLPNAAYLNEK